MSKNLTFAWVVAVVMTIAALSGWYKVLQMQSVVSEDAETLRAQERLRMAAEAYNPATFVRVDGDTLYYRVPQQVVIDNQTFVNQIETSAFINENLVVFGIPGNSGRGALLQLTEGAQLRIGITPRESGGLMVDIVYVLP